MDSKPKSRLEAIAAEAEKHAKASKKAAPAHAPSPHVCPACHQPLPDDAAPAPQGPAQNG